MTFTLPVYTKSEPTATAESRRGIQFGVVKVIADVVLSGYGLNALIGPDEVCTAAMKRYYREYEIGSAPCIIGCDVARFGAGGLRGILNF